MRWRGGRKSDNIEDARGISGGRLAIGGGIGVVILVVLGLLTGTDLSGVFEFVDEGSGASVAEGRALRQNDTTAEIVSVVLASTEDVWSAIFESEGLSYQAPVLRMFERVTSSACGSASSAVGPFYCPADQKIYIDLSFCDELRTRFKAPGNFAIAYVVAHEVGHHVQNLLGISQQVQSMRSTLSQKEYNKLSVQLELQADFFAGVWAFHERKTTAMIEPGDLEDALKAASAIGDDKLQMEAQGYVVPDAFTHGSSKQRMYWFRRGFQTGDLSLGKLGKIR